MGALWENYLISERMKQSYNRNRAKEFYFWRTYDNQEIDLIEESPEGLSAFEFKWGDKKTECPYQFRNSLSGSVFQSNKQRELSGICVITAVQSDL